MIREARQHAMVRHFGLGSYPNLPRQTRVVNRFETPLTRNGLVSPKPTNHSNSMTRIAHKGKRAAHKGRSKDVLINYQLAVFRLMGPTDGILDVLDHDYEEDEDAEEVKAICDEKW